MLIKTPFCGPDYNKSLRLRLWLGAAFLLVGLVGFACWFLVVPGSSLDDHARGFYLGAATGVTLGAVILLARTGWLLTHPTARKKAQIEDTDERELHITRTAAQFAGLFTFFVTAALLFWAVAAPLPAFKVLFSLMLCYGLSFSFARMYLSRKL